MIPKLVSMSPYGILESLESQNLQNHLDEFESMFRFSNPEAEVRVAGGREVCLKHRQAEALYPANSLFSEGYLTTPGQGAEADEAMIREAGFEIENPCMDQPETQNANLHTEFQQNL